MDASPARAYYLACQGRWRAPVSLSVPDPAALAGSGMAWVDRAQIRLLAVMPAWLGRVWMHTTVAVDGDLVVHTTTFRWLGLPVWSSVERFALLPDGSSFTVSGDLTGAGEVDASGTRASYVLRMLGVEVRQRTEREPDRVTVHQEGPGFTGIQVLERQV